MRMCRLFSTVCLLLLALPFGARGEAMLQYFNTSWQELTAKIPELAEVGYESLWLPPPTKGSGGLSVGYDLWDRFDLGSKDQRGSVRTRYGTEEELLQLIKTAHRFGIRIYFDNIMNHNAFDVPGFNEFTPIDVYPGFVAEDFHLRVTEDGFYRKWDNTRDWNDAWQVQHLGLADLIDIAHEYPNQNHGPSEGDWLPKKYVGVRHPNNPETYLDLDLQVASDHWGNPVFTFANKEPFTDSGWGGSNTGAGNGRFDWDDTNQNGQHDFGETSEPFVDSGLFPNDPIRTHGAGDGIYNMGNPVAEDVNQLLIRAARWQLDRTRADGYRLDAVKHVPDWFFGQQYGDKNPSGAGYLGQSQEQFNLTRGFSDWNNHRDTVFNTELPRDDAMMFGEHLGQPPGYGGYIDAGMRLVDNELRSYLNGNLAFGSLNGFDSPGAGGFGDSVAVMHAQSHDSDFVTKRDLQHAIYFTRTGLPLVYTDGNFQAETLGESGGAFPRHANTAFLGQFGNRNIPNSVFLHNHFARGYQKPIYSDDNVAVWERVDNRVDGINESEWATALFLFNKNGGAGSGYNGGTSFPATKFGADTYLKNYSTFGGGFSIWASDLNTVLIPPDGYFAFSYHLPEEAGAWNNAGGQPISFYQDGALVNDTLSYERRDGPDGDPGFNPYGVTDTNQTDYTYTWTVPRVTQGTNLSFRVRADGSTENVHLRLDGGVPLNGISHGGGDPRDYPPALSYDMDTGYEQATFRRRMHREKFAAEDTGNRNVIGSPGSETWSVVIGTAGTTTHNGSGTDSDDFVVDWIFHDPEISDAPSSTRQFDPAPESAANQAVDLWVKVPSSNDTDRCFVYYTTDGSFPEGAGGAGAGTTRTVPMSEAGSAGGGDWYRGTLPALPNGTQLRYKIGTFRDNAIASVFPIDAGAVGLKQTMLTEFGIDGFNGETVSYRPHNDYGPAATGLEEGFHIIKARTFINRSGGSVRPGSPLWNTFSQTFYYDTQTPGGEIRFPNENDTLQDQEYEVVVRTDRTVTGVLFHIADSSTANDDGMTGRANGNGVATNMIPQWVAATPVTTSSAIDSPYPNEYRFRYRNIPATGTATITVRLLELSSSADTSLTASQAHVTEIVRTVNTSGPDLPFFYDWPVVDGTPAGEGYTARVLFASTLANNYDDNALRDSFTFEIKAEGESSGTFQPKSDFRIVTRNRGDGLGIFEYDLPQLYNADAPNRLYELIAAQESFNGILSATSVKVRALPVPPEPFIDITEPEEVDIIGNRQDIILPVVALTPEDREQTIRVSTDETATNVWVLINGDAMPIVASTSNPVQLSPTRLDWTYTWAITNEGTFRITANMDTNNVPATVEAFDEITMTVRFVQIVTNNVADLDDDDDGILDLAEINNPGAPTNTNAETWTQLQIHDEFALGRSERLSPDSDNDGLPDGLELGFRVPRLPAETNLATDTDGDGRPNFIADLDPPFYNTLDNLGKVPDVNTASEGGDRRRLLYGATTDPNNPDSDYDGIPDGIEDANRNGWLDGDGEMIPGPWEPWLGRNWPDGVRNAGEVWLETDPNDPDTDDDGLSDGFEDANANGWIDGDTNSNRVYDPGEVWLETDPLNPDSDGDGLPDGWELTYQFNALDNGLDNLSTTNIMDGLVEHGANGNPDSDTVLNGGATNAYINLLEFNNGTHPRIANIGGGAPPDSITIGPGPVLGTINGREFREQFTDWTKDDLLVLDEYEGDGSNNRSGDIFPGYDGFDSSRDLVAFYVRDGGDIGAGGDGRMYFRADFQDLQAFAEEGHMDLYVVVDTGQPANGERNLPDDVDTVTEMRWEAVIAVYDSNNGSVYTDTNPASNSTDAGQDLTAFGVEVRDRNHPDGYKGGYFNSDLDAVEFAISRKALTDAGWNGINVDDLNFQVFTTREGTRNSPVGPGDIGGRSDIRDSIYDDRIAEDYWRAQNNFDSTLYSYFSRSGSNDRGKCAKIAVVMHGNQHVKPGSEIQDLINNNAGAGYHRAIEIHGLFGATLNLHITPILASAIQWAAVDPAINKPWRDGPAFNAQIADLVSSNVIELLGSTFSDHMLPYVPTELNQQNVALANEVLTRIYGKSPSPRVLWAPERLVDDAVLSDIAAMGYSHTLVDQMRHIWKWFGRTSALSTDGYRINRVNGTDCFVINDQASGFRFTTNDKGLGLSLRSLVSRRARSGTQDQLVTLFIRLEEFAQTASADAWDTNLRWLANRGWISLVSLDDVAAGEVDLSQPPDGSGDPWFALDRGTAARTLTSQDFVDHATRENYDRWYFGADIEEGLANKVFDVRPGTPLPAPFGNASTGGVSQVAWQAARDLNEADLQPLGRGTLFAALFQTAFHDQDNNNLSKFSTGEYIFPDADPHDLAEFAAIAHSQVRFASPFTKVEAWHFTPPATTQTEAVDVDQDGEVEYLIYNDRLFLLLERMGGRCTHAWVRNPASGNVYQFIGNPLAYANSLTEEEGFVHVTPQGGVGAHRTSALKDWYGESGGSGASYVNDLYTVTAAANGWTLTSSDGKVAKTISLDNTDWEAQVAYSLTNLDKLFVRHGLSPHLWDLFVYGQQYLDALTNNAGTLQLRHASPGAEVFARVGLGANVLHNASAVDDDPANSVTFETINMRNQAQTEQVELEGTGTFSFTLGATIGEEDSDLDEIPDSFEIGFPGILNPNDPNDATMDEDLDGFSNRDEYIAGTDIQNPASKPSAAHRPIASPTTRTIRFPTVSGREYFIWYLDVTLPVAPNSWQLATPAAIPGTGGMVDWTDDGSTTDPDPGDPGLTRRYYRVEVRMP